VTLFQVTGIAASAWNIPTRIRDRWRANLGGKLCGYPIAAPERVAQNGVHKLSQRFQNGTISLIEETDTALE